MMKHILTTLAIAAALTSPVAIQADEQQSFFDGRRIEYYTEQGELTSTSYFYEFNIPIFRVHGGGDTFSVSDPTGFPCYSAKIIPWGINSYDLEISATPCSQGEVKVGGFEILNDETKAPHRAMRAQEGNIKLNLLSGTEFRFYIDVPEGTKPNFQGEVLLTSNGYPWTYNCSGLIYTINLLKDGYHYSDWIAHNERDFIYDRLDYISPSFIPDENVPNRYWVTYVMVNEPLKLTASADVCDSELLKMAVNGAYCSMYCFGGGNPFDTGEFSIMWQLGEGMGQDMYNPIYIIAPTWKLFFEMNFHDAGYILSSTGWCYSTALIEQCNYVLHILDRFNFATQQEREIARAQLLTLRSHAYLRLLQIFAPRWEDSDGGNAKCAPIIPDFSKDNHPLASMNEILSVCYTDLKNAIETFEKSGYQKGSLELADAAVAHGTLARLAMLRHDWSTARDHAARARKGKPLASNNEIRQGFFQPTQNWIWGYGRALGYATTTAFTGCNGSYANFWNMGSGIINSDLYRQMDPADPRREMFITPDNFPGAMKRDINNWYSSANINENGEIYTSSDITQFKALLSKYSVPAGCDPCMQPYQFGGQLKFYQHELFNEENCDYIVYMRAEEMLLTEAEAAYMLGDYAAAKALVEELGKTRMGSGYTAPESGQELLDRIRLERRAELWGEGFSWFDYKRWNLPMNRKAWKAGDTNSGFYPCGEDSYISPDHCNGWRIPIPVGALKYNPAIDISEMHYTGVSGYEQAQQIPAAAPAPASTPANRHPFLRIPNSPRPSSNPVTPTSLMTAPSFPLTAE